MTEATADHPHLLSYVLSFSSSPARIFTRGSGWWGQRQQTLHLNSGLKCHHHMAQSDECEVRCARAVPLLSQNMPQWCRRAIPVLAGLVLGGNTQRSWRQEICWHFWIYLSCTLPSWPQDSTGEMGLNKPDWFVFVTHPSAFHFGVPQSCFFIFLWSHWNLTFQRVQAVGLVIWFKMSAQHEQNLLSSVQPVLVALIENTAIPLLCSAKKQSAFFFFLFIFGLFFSGREKFLIEFLLALYKPENPQNPACSQQYSQWI